MTRPPIRRPTHRSATPGLIEALGADHVLLAFGRDPGVQVAERQVEASSTAAPPITGETVAGARFELPRNDFAEAIAVLRLIDNGVGMAAGMVEVVGNRALFLDGATLQRLRDVAQDVAVGGIEILENKTRGGRRREPLSAIGALHRAVRLVQGRGVIGAALFNSTAAEAGRLAALVSLEGAGSREAMKRIAHDLAMHVAANPTVENREVSGGEGGWASLDDNLVARMLLEQPFHAEPHLTVQQWLTKASTELDAPLRIAAVARFQAGEGLSLSGQAAAAASVAPGLAAPG